MKLALVLTTCAVVLIYPAAPGLGVLISILAIFTAVINDHQQSQRENRCRQPS